MSDLAKALAKAQAEFPPIGRSKEVRVQTKTGGSYTFTYEPLDAILNTVRPVLAANGLAFSQLLGHVGGQAALKTMLMHEGGEVIQDSCPLPTNGSLSAQEFGSLVTYFRRYALVAVLGIATEEDDDGNHASGNRISGGGVPINRATGATPPEFSDEEYEEYLAASEHAQRPGALPSEQLIHFGKNKGKRLDKLTPAQLRWYAEDWKLQDDPSPYDARLKMAAQSLHRGEDLPDFDVPFD